MQIDESGAYGFANQCVESDVWDCTIDPCDGYWGILRERQPVVISLVWTCIQIYCSVNVSFWTPDRHGHVCLFSIPLHI